MRRKQKEVFIAINDMKYEIQNLSGFMQNDFRDLIEDERITKIELCASVQDMDKMFNRVIAKLNRLREDSHDVMSYYINEWR